MSETLQCWKCGAPIEDAFVARTAECDACAADLHVCLMCEFHDPRVAGECREPIAERVLDKQRANFCDYFRARPGAHRPAGDEATREAKAKLDELFGGATTEGSASDPDLARAELERLFGLPGKD